MPRRYLQWLQSGRTVESPHHSTLTDSPSHPISRGGNVSHQRSRAVNYKTRRRLVPHTPNASALLTAPLRLEDRAFEGLIPIRRFFRHRAGVLPTKALSFPSDLIRVHAQSPMSSQRLVHCVPPIPDLLLQQSGLRSTLHPRQIRCPTRVKLQVLDL